MNNFDMCPICCEGKLETQHKMVSLKCEDGVIMAEQKSHFCKVCGTETATADDLKFNARSARAASLRYAGRLDGSDIYQLRKRLDITQEIAGKLFGGGPVAFCKYEKSDLSPTEAMDNLLWVAKQFPFIAVALAERNKVELGSEFSVRDSEPRLTVSPLSVTQRSSLLMQVSNAIINSHKSFSWGGGTAICNASNSACNENKFNLSLAS